MAEVFMAEHRHLGQVRAVKVVLPEIARHPGLVGRLLTEARATARLRHPAIVQVFDCDTLPQGGAFIAMEYLNGEPVSHWLQRTGGLAAHPRLAAAIGAVLAEGLGFAHERGVIHRDIKPENLFLVPEPKDPCRFSLRILDFGVAKLLGEEPLITTRDGTLIGTPVYMAPEQCRSGSVVDARADIYSLGCVLFELLANRPPFICVDGWEMLQAHIAEAPPSLAILVPGVPRELAQLVAGMLAKSPLDRPQTMAEVSGRLAAFLACEPGDLGALLLAPRHLPVAGGPAAGAHSGGGVTLVHLGPGSPARGLHGPQGSPGSPVSPGSPGSPVSRARPPHGAPAMSAASESEPARTQLVQRRSAPSPRAKTIGAAAIGAVIAAAGIAALAGGVFRSPAMRQPEAPVPGSADVLRALVPPANAAVPPAAAAKVPITIQPPDAKAQAPSSAGATRAADRAGRSVVAPKPTATSSRPAGAPPTRRRAGTKIERSGDGYLPVAD
jgi:serine/threonine protein kinase